MTGTTTRRPCADRIRQLFPLLLLVLLTASLSGCAVTGPGPSRPTGPAPRAVTPPPTTPGPVEAPPPIEPKPGEVARPTGPAGSLYLEAEAALRAGDPRRAEILVERALRIDQGNPRYWHLLGRAKYDQGAYPQAVQFFRKAESRIGGDRELAQRNRQYLDAAAAKAGGRQ